MKGGDKEGEGMKGGEKGEGMKGGEKEGERQLPLVAAWQCLHQQTQPPGRPRGSAPPASFQ